MCLESCNVNGEDPVDVSDPVFLLQHLFSGGEPPAAPYPQCEAVPAEDCQEEICGV